MEKKSVWRRLLCFASVGDVDGEYSISSYA